MHDQTLLQLIDDYFLPKGYRGAPDFIREFHNYVLPLIKELPFSKNLLLFTQYSIPNCIFFLLSGVAYSSMDYPYRSMPIAPFLWLAPAIIGDGRGFYKQKPARFSVALQGFAKIYALERKHLKLIEDRFPNVRAHIRLAIKQEQKAFKTWEDDLSRQKVPVRLQRLLKERPQLFRHILNKHLAAHLGIYEPYFSLLLNKYQNDSVTNNHLGN